MKKLIFLLIFCLLLTGCTGKSDTVILIATPSAASTAVLSATPSFNQSTSVEPSSPPSATLSAAASKEASPAATPTLAPSPTPSLTPSQEPSPTPAPTDAQPPLLQKSVTSLGRNLDSLRCEQLILVSASGSSCKVYTYERASDGIWTKVLGTSGYIGRNGVSSSKREGDKKTPLGIGRVLIRK